MDPDFLQLIRSYKVDKKLNLMIISITNAVKYFYGVTTKNVSRMKTDSRFFRDAFVWIPNIKENYVYERNRDKCQRA